MPKLIVNGKVIGEFGGGTKLGDLHHEIEKAGVEFGCTDGKCGVCVCTVKVGIDCLEDPSDTEEDTLWRIGEYEEDRRLTCQLIIKDNTCEVIELKTED